MTTFLGLNLYTWGGIITIFLTYFLLQKGAVENATKNAKDIKTHVTLTKTEILDGVKNLDEDSRRELMENLRPEFESISEDIKLSKDEIIKQAGDLDKQSRREIFNSLSPEFASVKEEINLSKEDLFERIKQLDQDSKKEILKLVRPKLEFIRSENEKTTEGKFITTLHFEVPSQVAIPSSFISIKSDNKISDATLSIVQPLHSNRDNKKLNIEPNGTEININLKDIAMNRRIEIILESSRELICDISTN